MAVSAAVTIYKQEMIAQFERRRSVLSMTCSKESMASGQSIVWLVNGSGGDSAVTRGVNGLIPYGQTSNTQVTGTLVPKYAAKRITDFDVFASQGNQTAALQTASYSIIRRDMDDTILTELANCTQDYGAAGLTLDTATILGARAALGYNDVPVGQLNNMFCAITHGAFAYLMQNTEFSNGQYMGDTLPYKNMIDPEVPYVWSGINFIVTNAISGKQTAAELMYMFHRDAIGYATNVGEEGIAAGFNEEQKYSWSIATIFHCSKILQDSGIIKITHDGTAFVTT